MDLAHFVKDLDIEAQKPAWDGFSKYLHEIGMLTSRCENPKLCFILIRINCTAIIQRCLDAEITDMWLPVEKRTLRDFLSEEDIKQFLKLQGACLDEDISRAFTRAHFSVADAECLDMKEVNRLGVGGYGEVWSVWDDASQRLYARKMVRRPLGFKTQVDYMRSFKKEVMGMRRVNHHHCVKLLASLTDIDSMVLICSPVADMDLTVFLNCEHSQQQVSILRRAPGCITSALSYLHGLGIRHDDLKPNNILIHGSNFLLTDFGFCLDASDSGITTTMGPPRHFVRRYSAPEVFSHEPRNRLTDIWGLGCVLFEIVSRMRGYRLEEVRNFWRATGNCVDSYAENPAATKEWYRNLTAEASRTQYGDTRREILLVSFIYHILLEPDRLLRPTAAQVLVRLKDMDLVYPAASGDNWVEECCSGLNSDKSLTIPNCKPLVQTPEFNGTVPEWPILDLACLDNHLAYLFLDLELNTLARSENLYFLDQGFTSSLSKDIESLIPYKYFQWLQSCVPYMLNCLGLPAEMISKQKKQTLQLHELLKSLYVCSLSMTAFVVAMHTYNGKRAYPRLRMKQMTLATLCLERHPQRGNPFLVLTIDLGNNQDIENCDGEQKQIWTDGLLLRPDVDARRLKWHATCLERKRRFNQELQLLRIPALIKLPQKYPAVVEEPIPDPPDDLSQAWEII